MNKKKLLFHLWVVICALTFAGCDDDEECKEYAIDSLYQTFWQGTYENNGESLNIKIGFSDKNNGMYKLENEETEGFNYTQAKKRVTMSDDQHKLSGDWYISTATNKKLILKQRPFEENSKTLNLNSYEF